MPRYRDEWVIDRVLIDYVSGGSCACCGLVHSAFLPNGTADWIHAMTDLESDQAQQEIDALQHHPWPVDLRDRIWSDRVKLRQKLKQEMKTYKMFWSEHGEAYQEWCCRQQTTDFWKRIFQFPRSEILEMLTQKYNIHSAYAVVLCAVIEQVACFEITAYPVDGQGEAEVAFEKKLIFDRRAGFTLAGAVSEDDSLNEDVLRIWWNRHQSLSGPKLLERGCGSSTARRRDDDDDEGDQEAEEPVSFSSTTPTPSFQSDRRIIRLLIARYWADILQKRYLADHSAGEALASKN